MTRGEIAALISRRRWAEAQAAIAEVAGSGTRAAAADCAWLRGLVAYWQERCDEAVARHEEALGIYRELKDRLGEANALRWMGDALRMQGRYAEALARHEEALGIYRELKYRQGEANALHSMGDALRGQGRYPEALARHEEALGIYRELKDRLGEATALYSMGEALRGQGRDPEALARHEEALGIYRELKSRVGEANALDSMGDALRRQGRYSEALGRHEEALGIYREVKSRLGEANARRSLGRCLRQLGKVRDALEHIRQAEAGYRELGLPRWAAIAASDASEIEALMSGTARPPEQTAMSGLLQRAGEQLGPLLEGVDRSDKDREAFLAKRGGGPGQAMFFAREWNSWQPLVPGESAARGGGYLLRWGGKGLVVDPGPGFLANLHDGGFGLADVDGVLVTHNHIDHVAELPHILTLVHEYNELHPAAKRKVDLFLAPSVLEAYAGMVATSQDVGGLVRLMEGEPTPLAGYCIEALPLHARHKELGGSEHALSVALKLLSPAEPGNVEGTVAFTGDTGWAEDLPLVAAFHELPRPRLLVAHLGSIMSAPQGEFHPNHLEYLGAAALIARLSDMHELPERIVLSEFGLECRAVLRDMVSGLDDLVGGSGVMCAGSMGRVVLLPSMAVACDYSGWGDRGCCEPSEWWGLADDLTRTIYRCKKHEPGR